MEAEFDKAEKRIEEQYDKDPSYVFNLAMIHNKDVHPIMVASTLDNAKQYVRRVVKIFNKKQMDADLLAHYHEDMWVQGSDTLHIFQLAPGSEYRILRMKIDDYSYLDKQEELANNVSAKSPADNLSV